MIYDPYSGEVIGVFLNGRFVPRDLNNADWQAFLLTNPDLTPQAPTARRPRDLRLIVVDLDALTAQQKGNVWAYINGAGPDGVVRWKKSNQGEVWICLRLSELVADPLRTQMRLTAVALYCRNEDPAFLVNPSWWPADGSPVPNVPGDEPVT